MLWSTREGTGGQKIGMEPGEGGMEGPGLGRTPFRPAAAAWESQSGGVHCLNLLPSFSTAAQWRGIQQ